MADQAFKNIIYYKDNETGIAQITLNRPEIKNALSMLVLLEWYDAVEMVDQDDTVKGVIITGAPHPEENDPTREAFSSGGYFDFSELEAKCEDVHFSHKRGFVCKTSATDSARLREVILDALA